MSNIIAISSPAPLRTFSAVHWQPSRSLGYRMTQFAAGVALPDNLAATDVAEARSHLAELDAALSPGSGIAAWAWMEHFVAAVDPHRKPVGEDETKARFTGIWETCRELPAVAWSNDSRIAFQKFQKFFPKPAEVFGFLDAWCDRLRRQRSACRAIVREAARKAAAEAEQAKRDAEYAAGDRRKAQEAVAEFLATQQRKEQEAVPKPYTPSRMDILASDPRVILAQLDDIARNSPNEGLRRAAKIRVAAIRASLTDAGSGVSQ